MKSILMSVLLIAFVSTVSFGATHSYFNKSVSLTGITFSSGSVDLQITQVCTNQWFDNTVTAATFNNVYDGCKFNFGSGWYPGEESSQTLYLKNTSTDNVSLNTTVQLANYSQVNGLGNAMELHIWWNGDATGTGWHPLSYYASNPVELVNIAQGQAPYFTFDMKMVNNAGNSYENGNVSFDLYFDGTQQVPLP